MGKLVVGTLVVILVAQACAMAVAETSAPALDKPGIRYVALGDSYTIGTSVPTNERWPNQLVGRLAASHEIEIVGNLAANGASTADVIRNQLPALGDLRPDFVSVLIGVNDVVRGVPETEYRVNVVRILDAVLREVPRERIVVISTPDYTRTPRGADFGDPEQQRAAIARFNSLMAEAASARGIAFVDISPIADQAGTDPTLVAGDGLHPSGHQYARWVDLIAPVVDALL